uniref:Uncharacterized protein n=1 Tax=Sipha flava TaxID=143950 RepID=A0A2S2QTC5_9HEMI
MAACHMKTSFAYAVVVTTTRRREKCLIHHKMMMRVTRLTSGPTPSDAMRSSAAATSKRHAPGKNRECGAQPSGIVPSPSVVPSIQPRLSSRTVHARFRRNPDLRP